MTKAALERVAKLEAKTAEKKQGVSWVQYLGPTTDNTLVGASKALGGLDLRIDRYADESEPEFRDRVMAATCPVPTDPKRRTMTDLWRSEMIASAEQAGLTTAGELENASAAEIMAKVLRMSVDQFRAQLSARAGEEIA